MSLTRPFYAARITGAPDVPVSVREAAGQMILDSARAPHVDGSLTLAVPDVGILEDLDPRDARRLILDVYPDSHLGPVYSAWAEVERNRFTNPIVNGSSVTGWSVIAGTGGVAGVGNVAGVTPPVGAPATREARAQWTTAATGGFPSFNAPRVPVVPGETLPYLLFARRATAGILRLRLTYLQADGVTTSAPTQVVQTSPSLPAPGTAAAWWECIGVTPVMPAGTAFVRFEFAPASGELPAAGFWIGVTCATTAADRSVFDGATNPTGVLDRTQWTGPTNNSASVRETRVVTGWEQVPDGAPRTFDLGIRESTPARADGTVQVQLASDEALLDDFAQLADDKGARVHEASLRGVVNYALSKIGAALEPGGGDADVTAYWAITNLITNPRLATNANGWQLGLGASLGQRTVMSAPLPPVGNTVFQWTAAAGDSNAIPLSTLYRVTPGKWYVFTAYICSQVARQARAAVQWWAAGGSVASSTSYGVLVGSDVTAFRRLVVIAQCPPGADGAVPYVNTIGNAAGNLHFTTMAMFYEGDELVPYYDGDTPDSATYEYAWQAVAHGSTATRTPVIDRPPAALTMRAGVSGLQFLAPLVQAAGFRLVCNERRKWTLRADVYREPGSQSYREGVNIILANEQLSRSSDEWFDGAVFVYTWTDDDGIEQTRIDAYALPGATKVIRREIRAPYPGPGRAQYAVGRAQGRGRIVTASKQADWTEAAEQEFSALLDGTPIQTGIANRVEFDIGANTVTTTSRTTEIPAGAIDLLAGTINNLTGTINNL